MDAILLAAGDGSRMNINFPKQFLKINGKPIFIYSLEVLRMSDSIKNIIVTCNINYLGKYKQYIEDFGIEDVTFINGGKTRQESVFLGLKHVSSSRVLIHEAARPLIAHDFIEHLMSFKNEDAVVPTVPVKFTVSVGDDYMTSELDRTKLHNIQLPQIFNTNVLLEAHKRANEEGYFTTEDGTLVFHYGGKVRFVEGRESNIKVTTNLDIEMVNNLIKFH
jgi:2-C-methyl-D-erythritol 4-phosphate cytidylyltransferase